MVVARKQFRTKSVAWSCDRVDNWLFPRLESSLWLRFSRLLHLLSSYLQVARSENNVAQQISWISSTSYLRALLNSKHLVYDCCPEHLPMLFRHSSDPSRIIGLRDGQACLDLVSAYMPKGAFGMGKMEITRV